MSTPLGKAAWGFLLAALDLRINGVDLLPDPVGWVLAAVGVWALAGRSLGFRVAAVLASVEAVVSLPLVVSEEIPAPLSSLDVLLQTGFVFAVCSGLIAALPHRPDKAGSANSSGGSTWVSPCCSRRRCCCWRWRRTAWSSLDHWR
ncbi:MAG: hypothetical protein R2731_14115 [Nocardioides sp.]